MNYIDWQEIASELDRVRHIQATAVFGKTHTTRFADRIAGVVCEVTRKAIEDRSWKAAPAPTGSGKSTTLVALIATLLKLEPWFSTSVSFPNRALADEFFASLRDLLIAMGEPEITRDEIAIWSTAHEPGASEDTISDANLPNGRPVARFTREAAARRRCVFVSHQKMVNDFQDASNKPDRMTLHLTHLDGTHEPRSVVFIDEQPQFVQMQRVRLSEIMALAEGVRGAGYDQADLFDQIAERASKAHFGRNGTTYRRVPLLSPEDAARFAHWTYSDCLAFVPRGTEHRFTKANDMLFVLAFLQDSAKDCAFFSMSEGQPVFHSYQMDVPKGVPIVFTDATFKQSTLALAASGIEVEDVPEANYEDLEITFVEPPREFSSVRRVIRDGAKRCRPYVSWMREVLIANTEPGETVILVARKSLYDNDYIRKATTPTKTVNIAGRRVYTLHHGAGLGPNNFKDATSCFIFGEFLKPRASIRSAINGVRGNVQIRDQSDLDPINARELGGVDRSVRDYAYLAELKQLATRGAVRDLDDEGRAPRMRLFVTTDDKGIVEDLPSLFPQAPRPKTLNLRKRKSEDTTEGVRGKPQAALRTVIREAKQAGIQMVSAKDVEEATRIKANKLRTFVNEHPVTLDHLTKEGWRVASLKEIGFPGRGNCLTSLPAGR